MSLDPASIVIAADNSGAETDPSKAIEVTATWFFDPVDKTALVVDYEIKVAARRALSASYGGCKESRLSFPAGRVPPEVSEASGGG